jgi:hypothetical protein
MSFANLRQGSSQGRPSMYMGTAPGTEVQNNNRGLTGSSSAAPGGFPFGSMNPTRTINQTMGFQTNPTINYAYICRRFKSGFDKALNVGQIVFIRKKAPPTGFGSQMYTLMNLPQMNYYLEQLALQVQDGAEGDLVNAIHNEWAPIGVVQGEVGGDVADQPQERLLNVTVSGRTRTFNIFGNKCPDGTPLYIVLKNMSTKANATNEYVLSLNGTNSKTVPRAGAGGAAAPKPLYRYEAYADSDKPYPSGKEIKKVYYIGRVSRNSKMKSVTSGATNSSHRSVRKMVTLPMLEMFVDYDFCV